MREGSEKVPYGVCGHVFGGFSVLVSGGFAGSCLEEVFNEVSFPGTSGVQERQLSAFVVVEVDSRFYEKLDHGMIQSCDKLQELWLWGGKENINDNFDLFDGNVPRDLVIHARYESDGHSYAQRSGIAYEKIP